MRFFVLALLMAFSGLSHAAGFDCAMAASRVEVLICGDEGVSTLDGVLSRYYKQAITLDEGVKQSQREWIKERDACPDAECLSAAYVARIDVLEKMVNSSQAEAPAAESASVDEGSGEAASGDSFAAPEEVQAPAVMAAENPGVAPVVQEKPAASGPIAFIGENWKIILILMGVGALVIVWKGVESQCPACRKWFGKEKVSAEILEESRGFKTVDRKDLHKDGSGKVVKTVHRQEQISVINREWQVFCRCTRCQHEWSYREKTQSES